MIAVIAGTLTAIIWTIATLSSAQASRRIGAPSTVAGVAFVGLIATIPLLATAPLPTAADLPQLPWLVLTGATNIIGLLASYGALRRGKISIVAPIGSTEGAIAATLAILAGEPVTAVLFIALSLVVTGVVMTAYGPEGDERATGEEAAARKGGPVFLAMAVSSAVLFGVSLFAVGHASTLVPAAWIVAAGRIFGVLFIALPLVLTGRLRITREALPFVLVCGVAEVLGFLTVTWGSRDSIAVTAVLASQFAVLTVIVSMFLGERVQRHQFAGAVLTGVGVAAVTLVQVRGARHGRLRAVQNERMTVEPSDAGLSLPVLPRAAWVEVDLGAIVGNILALGTLAGPGCELAAVVKADGYGHGIELAARAARHAGAAYASVAALDEALRLRAAGDTGAILVNYPVPVDALGEAAAAAIEVVAGSEPDISALARMGLAAPAVHLEVDTGMTRGGLALADLGEAGRRLAAASVPIRGVWSHLLDYQDPSRVRQQVAAFEEAIAGLRRLGIDPPLRHLSASGGLLSGAPTYDLVRPGLVMYGVPPEPSMRDVVDHAGLRPALAVVAEPVRIADVPAGTTVGYSGTWVADRPSRIATLPIGYADSWARGAGPRTPVLFRGQRVPVVGPISSDSMTVDITDVPGSLSGGRFVLLGRDGDDVITADDVAASRDTISWEVLQALSHRLPRRYLLDGAVVAIRRSDRFGVDAVPDLDERLATFHARLEAMA